MEWEVTCGQTAVVYSLESHSEFIEKITKEVVKWTLTFMFLSPDYRRKKYKKPPHILIILNYILYIRYHSYDEILWPKQLWEESVYLTYASMV